MAPKLTVTFTLCIDRTINWFPQSIVYIAYLFFTCNSLCGGTKVMCEYDILLNRQSIIFAVGTVRENKACSVTTELE